MPQPHVRLATIRAYLQQADPPGAYLDRAKYLVRSDPDLWYFCGQREFFDEQLDQAWQSWRKSLELSDSHLSKIVALSAVHLSAQELMDRVLPANPRLLFRAASQLYPDAAASAERRPFLDRALALLKSRPVPLTGEDLHLKASIHALLGDAAEAVAAYQEAFRREPRQFGWRWEFAKLLHQQGRLRECQQELSVVLSQYPGHAEARALLQTIERGSAAVQD
jgi:tetratricopeptide (TPR) repeat protein